MHIHNLASYAQALRMRRRSRLISIVGCLTVMLLAVSVGTARAIEQIPVPGPKSNTYGLEATKKQPPPSSAPTISTPGNGSSYSTSPITVSGVCTTGLLVQVYNNGVMAGAIDCKNGSFSIQVSLFTGQNELTAFQYDDLDQASPVSNTVTVTFNNGTTGTAFSSPITLTSNFGRRAANPGTQLTWPLILSGGLGPYAFSIDWGDGGQPELKSQAIGGVVNISHIYKQAGLYRVTVKVTDANGQSAFLQLIAIANGQPTSQQPATGSEAKNQDPVAKVLWIPAVISVVLLIPAYWLGRRSMMVSLRRKLEKDMENYKEL